METTFWKGQQLEITIPNQEVYYTQIVESGPRLFIQRPQNRKNQPILFRNGEFVHIHFHGDNKMLYTFNSTLHHLAHKAFWLTPPSKEAITKAQRRRFFRVQVAIDIELILPSPNQKPDEVHRTSTYDISGGGICFISEQKINEEGMVLKGTLSMNKKTTKQDIYFVARVVRTLKLSNGMFRNSLEFTEITENNRTTIIQFCMAKQIELRNKMRGISMD